MKPRGRVLIVDDERFNITLLVSLLRDSCDILVAKSGEQALRAVHSATPPDLILLDIVMPEMDGYEVCRQLKADATTSSIPVIFITAMHDSKDEVKGFDLGAVDYITKPISPAIVRARVQTHLENVLAHNEIHSLNGELTQALAEQKKAYADLHQARIELAETQAMALMTRAFEKFVPKQFLARIAPTGLENIRPGTVELSVITIMFSDIRSFTKLSESMSPEDVFALLNSYLENMQGPIEEQHGFIDKFIGDAIMVLFDGSDQEQATHAVLAAVGMQERLAVFNRERRQRQQEVIRTGTGLHIGPVMLGTLGNANRMDSTVIGDAANVAARLEGLTKFYGCSVIVSDDVFRLLESERFLSRPLDRVVVKGRQRALLIHEIFDADPEPQRHRKQALLPSYRLGLELFQERQWRESQQAFLECLRIAEDDTVARIHMERCAAFLERPPAADWDGSFEMQTK
ncbi:MAG: response regulator [Magnetococcales bacterium]|nr:response regulator [Magnetococcales bacterium]